MRKNGFYRKLKAATTLSFNFQATKGCRLNICHSQGCEGSTPFVGTYKKKSLQILQGFFFILYAGRLLIIYSICDGVKIRFLLCAQL